MFLDFLLLSQHRAHKEGQNVELDSWRSLTTTEFESGHNYESFSLCYFRLGISRWKFGQNYIFNEKTTFGIELA